MQRFALLFCFFWIAGSFFIGDGQACVGQGLKELSVFPGMRPPSEALARIRGCDAATASGALQVGLAPIAYKLESDLTEISLNRDLRDDRCRIQGAPRGNSPIFSERRSVYLERFSWMDRCVRILAQDAGPGGIDFFDPQPGCIVRRLSETSLELTPGYCFLRLRPDSDILLQPFIAPECAAAGLRPQEVPAQLEVAWTGDASGTSPVKRVLSLHGIAFNEGAERGFPEAERAEEIDGQPVWPGKWVADAAFGELIFQQKNESAVKLSLPLWVDHRCGGGSGAGSTEASPCDYSLPFAGELIFRVDGERTARIQSYLGGFIPPRWQGLLKTMPLLGDDETPLPMGREAELELRFTDPSEDWVLLRTRMEQIRIDLGQIQSPGGGLPTPGSSAGLPVLQPLPELPARAPLPGFPNLSGPERDGLRDLLDKLLKSVGGAAKNFYFRKVCLDSPDKCLPVRAGTWWILKSRFILDSVDPRTGRVTLRNRQDSPRLSPLEPAPGNWNPVVQPPRVVCGGGQ